MRIIAKLDETRTPPMLRLNIFDAPHRRQHEKVMQRYREALFAACVRAGISLPIDYPVDLSVLFVNPSTPDLGNAYLALERALDGGAMTKHNAVLADDSLISKTEMAKFYPQGVKK